MTLADTFDESLVTMAWGEAVLACGALLNLAHLGGDAVTRNVIAVAISNVVMATHLTHALRRRGVRIATTLALWVVALDGSGALLFALFARLLERSPLP